MSLSDRPLRPPARARVLAPFALALAACGSTPEPPRPVPASAPARPWTQAFLRPAVLVADEIRIEGPVDLLQHVASLQDPATTSYTTRTTADGLLQETVVRPGVGGVEIAAQLDALELKALRRLSVLQRFAGGPVSVHAEGNVYWADATTGEERRGETLTLRGVPGE